MEFQKRPQDVLLTSPNVKNTSSVALVCSPVQQSDRFVPFCQLVFFCIINLCKEVQLAVNLCLNALVS